MMFLSPSPKKPVSTRAPSPAPPAPTPTPAPAKKGYFASLRLRPSQPPAILHRESFLDDLPERSSTLRRPRPPKSPYPDSRAAFSLSLPHVQHFDLPPPPPSPVPATPPTLRAPNLLAAFRRTTPQRPEPLIIPPAANLKAPDASSPRVRRRSFGPCMRPGTLEPTSEPESRIQTPAPELPPLPPLSPFQWHDNDRLLRSQLQLQLPVSPTRSSRLSPSLTSPIHPPPHTLPPVAPLNIQKRPQQQQQERPPTPGPGLGMDNVWEDFLVETEEDVSGLDLHGVLKASLELDFLSDSPVPRSPSTDSTHSSRRVKARPRPRVSRPLPLPLPLSLTASPGHFLPSRPAPSPPRPSGSGSGAAHPHPRVPRLWPASDSDTTPDMGSPTSSLGSSGTWDDDDDDDEDGAPSHDAEIEWGYAL